MTSNKSPVLSQIRRLLSELFSEGELRTFAFDLNVDYDDLAGDTKQDKARELVLYFSRRGAIAVLVEALEYERPNADLTSVSINEETKGFDGAIPGELRLDFKDRKALIGNSQGRLLDYIAAHSKDRSYASQGDLETAFPKYKKSELFYRLEQLRLLGFLDREKLGQEEPPRFVYRLSSQYHKYVLEGE